MLSQVTIHWYWLKFWSNGINLIFIPKGRLKEEAKGHLVAEEKLDHEDSEDLKVNLGHQDCKVPREDQEQKEEREQKGD